MRLTPDFRPSPPLRASKGIWCDPARRKSSLLGAHRFRFLNEEHEIDSSFSWNNPVYGKLWLYNLHYFDDLNAYDFEIRRDWHKTLLQRWVKENPSPDGNGWEPYPISLRIVNWIKWALAGNALSQELLDSLAVQTRFLKSRLEIHLLGNHLLANAKALVFAGLFFQGSEAEAWLNKGLKILFQQLPEQILADGGHFEQSPMYHCIILEDILDLINLSNVYRNNFPPQWSFLRESWSDDIQRMRHWLKVMTHPDGNIALFNDSALGISCDPNELDSYAQRLGFGKIENLQDGITSLRQSGYIRIQCEDAILILDVGQIGPDYLPAHAHADTLSFELSLYGHRFIVDSGTSCYTPGIHRQYERSTAAHNTVQINGKDSSEVWSSFRVARRAKPRDLMIEEGINTFRVICAHNGYQRLPGQPIHYREWFLKKNELIVKDVIRGPFQEAESRFHFYPRVSMEKLKSTQEGSALLASGEKIEWKIKSGISDFEKSTYHPEFGLSQKNNCLKIKFQSHESQINFAWKSVAQ